MKYENWIFEKLYQLMCVCMCVLQPANPHYFHAISEKNNAGQLQATESYSFHGGSLQAETLHHRFAGVEVRSFLTPKLLTQF